MNLSSILEEKGLELLAEAVNVKGESWGLDWIKNNSGIKSGDVASASDEEIEKLKNAQNAKMKNLVDIIKNSDRNKEETRTKRYVRAGLALLIIGVTLNLFYEVIFPDTTPNSIKSNNEIVMYILGALSAVVTQIVSFYFGSSETDSKIK